MSSLRRRLADGPVALGWSETGSAAVVALLARTGHDAVLLDQQHGAYDTAACRAGIAEAALAGVPAIVRVKVGDYAEAARMLDAGAAGIVAPMIDGAEDARRFVREVKYPPLGARSWGPGRAAQLRGQTPAEYLASANAETLAIAMCETRTALSGLDEILAVPGLDGILVGPSDLSLALTGGRLDPEGREVRAAMRDVAARVNRAGLIACAFAAGPVRARELIAEGYRMVSCTHDSSAMATAFSGAARAFRNGA